MNIIEIQNLAYRWPRDTELTIDIERFDLKQGEKLFIHGASGSGKSTFLSLLSGINSPLPGSSLKVLNQELTQCSAARRDRFRADNIGYIFQQFNLIPYLSVIENVLLPCHFSPQRRAKVGGSPSEKAAQLLEKLHLNKRFFNVPVTELSIGQQQRVAAARALIGAPSLIIADEPSSALDKVNCQAFIELLLSECAHSGSSLVFVSHDESLQGLFDSQVCLSDLNKAQGVNSESHF